MKSSSLLKNYVSALVGCAAMSFAMGAAASGKPAVDPALHDQALAIHTDVFDGVLRHVAGILDEEDVLPAEGFWAEVRRCLDVLALMLDDVAFDWATSIRNRPWV